MIPNKSRLTKQKLRIFIFLCVGSLAATLTGAVFYYIGKFQNHIADETYVRLEETAQFSADHIITIITETQKKLRGVAAAVAAMDSSAQRLAYLRLVSRESGFVYLGYANYDGVLRATISSESGYVGDQEYFLSALLGRDFISDYIRKIFSNRAARGILLSVPIFATDSRTVAIGCLVAMIDAKRLKEGLNLQSFNGDGYAYIINREGTVIMRTRSLDFDNIFLAWKHRKFASGYSLEEFQRQVEEEQNGITVFADAGGQKQYAYHYALPFNNWTLISMVSQEAVAAVHVRMIRDLSILGGTIVMVFASLIGYAFYSYWLAWRSRVAEQTKSGFLSSMSHEIRTPLNGIIGLNYLMRANVDDKEKMLRFLGQSQSTAKYLLSLINDILDINKLDANKMEMASQPFCLNRLVENIISIFSSILRAKDIEFVVNCQLLHPSLIGDEVRLKQVVTNILGNASKFTPKGGTITFEISQEEPSQGMARTRMVISDTGCGMSEEFQRKIFDAFSQERNTTSKGNEGTGLGMAISYQLMQKMGGYLSVKSEPGKGSSFTILFSSAMATEDCGEAETTVESVPGQTGIIPETQMEKETAEPQKKEAAGPQKINILVAEDNDLNRDLLQEILEMNGMKVSVAVNGKEAVEIFEASGPGEYAVILMDMQMPIMDGVTASRLIRGLEREDAATVKIYACTANSFEEDREKCMAAGMSGFLAKPVDVPHLLAVLEKEYAAKENE